jgi:hypothetical protein
MRVVAWLAVAAAMLAVAAMEVFIAAQATP